MPSGLLSPLRIARLYGCGRRVFLRVVAAEKSTESKRGVAVSHWPKTDSLGCAKPPEAPQPHPQPQANATSFPPAYSPRTNPPELRLRGQRPASIIRNISSSCPDSGLVAEHPSFLRSPDTLHVESDEFSQLAPPSPKEPGSSSFSAHP